MRYTFPVLLLLAASPAVFGQGAIIPPVIEGPPPVWKAGGEYVVWWLKRGNPPPVLTTSSPESQGLLGRPDTRVVYGDEGLETRHHDRFMGGRFFVEYVDPLNFGVEARALFLERDSTYFTIKPVESLLALAYTNARTNRPASEIIAGPDPDRGPLLGGFVGYSRIELFGQEVNAVVPLSEPGGPWRIDFLAGARFLQMRDRYHHTATSRNLEPADGFDRLAILDGVVDNIRVGNAYYGGQFGVRGEVDWGRFYGQGRVSGGVGINTQRYRAWGERVHHTPLVREVRDVGLFVQGTNRGERRRVHMDVAGEAGLNLGYRVTDSIDLFVGYTFLLWVGPLRAAEQLDTVVNTGQGRPARPGVLYEGSTFWAQGVNIGLQIRF